MPTPSIHLMRLSPKPKSPSELDERARARLRRSTSGFVLGAALRFYKSISENEDDDEEGVVDMPSEKKEEWERPMEDTLKAQDGLDD